MKHSRAMQQMADRTIHANKNTYNILPLTVSSNIQSVKLRGRYICFSRHDRTPSRLEHTLRQRGVRAGWHVHHGHSIATAPLLLRRHFRCHLLHLQVGLTSANGHVPMSKLQHHGLYPPIYPLWEMEQYKHNVNNIMIIIIVICLYMSYWCTNILIYFSTDLHYFSRNMNCSFSIHHNSISCDTPLVMPFLCVCC